MTRTHKRFFWGLLALLMGAWLLTGLTQVRSGERAVIRRFGRLLDVKPEPGLLVTFPWGIDRVDRVAVTQLRQVTVGFVPTPDAESEATPPGQLLTGDHNLVNVRVVLNYIVDAEAVLDFVEQQERVEEVLARVTETVLAEWVAGQTVDSVLVSGKLLLPRDLLPRIQARLQPYRLGVRVRNADVAYLLPPPEVKGAFEEVAQAETKIQTRVNEAEQAADRAWREATSEQYRREQQAASYRRERRLLAEAEAHTFRTRLDQYQRLRAANPDVLSAIWWDEMGKLFAQLQKNGQIDLLDHHLSKDGMDLIIAPKLPGKK
jgi:membrane protease subunit HflK